MMTDDTTTILHFKEVVSDYINERNWGQFHTPKSICMGMAVEVAELMELFLWVGNESAPAVLNAKREEIEDEVADILTTLVDFCSICNIDLAKALDQKMRKNKKKYPVEKVWGRTVKYTEIE